MGLSGRLRVDNSREQASRRQEEQQMGRQQTGRQWLASLEPLSLKRPTNIAGLILQNNFVETHAARRLSPAEGGGFFL